MAIEVGNVFEGRVTGVKPFGAFVALPEGRVGMVHISEVSNEFVQDIAAVLHDGDTVKVKKEVEEGVEVIGVKMPCVVTFTKPAWDPRYPTIKRKMAANKAEIPTLTAADLPSIDLEHAGLKGSPTKVKKTFVPQKKSGGVKIKEETNEDSAKKLCQLLSEAGII